MYGLTASPTIGPGRTSATCTVRSSRSSGFVRTSDCIWARLSIWNTPTVSAAWISANTSGSSNPTRERSTGSARGARDQVDALLDCGQHAQPEQVDLEEAGVGAGVLVPLADPPALHRRRQHRHQLDQRGGGDHHPARVLADVARQAGDLVHQEAEGAASGASRAAGRCGRRRRWRGRSRRTSAPSARSRPGAAPAPCPGRGSRRAPCRWGRRRPARRGRRRSGAAPRGSAPRGRRAGSRGRCRARWPALATGSGRGTAGSRPDRRGRGRSGSRRSTRRWSRGRGRAAAACGRRWRRARAPRPRAPSPGCRGAAGRSRPGRGRRSAPAPAPAGRALRGCGRGPA